MRDATHCAENLLGLRLAMPLSCSLVGLLVEPHRLDSRRQAEPVEAGAGLCWRAGCHVVDQHRAELRAVDVNDEGPHDGLGRAHRLAVRRAHPARHAYVISEVAGAPRANS